jgi:hypothetical protein
LKSRQIGSQDVISPTASCDQSDRSMPYTFAPACMIAL